MKKLLLISLLCAISLASCGVKFEGEIHGEISNDEKSSSVSEVSEESSADAGEEISVDITEESDEKDANYYASILSKAVNSAITDIREDVMYFKNYAVICSDSSKNINAVPENAGSDFDFIQDEVKLFFNAINDYEYIILIQNGKCVKTIVKKGDIGTYPEDEFEGMTFDEIYDEITKNISSVEESDDKDANYYASILSKAVNSAITDIDYEDMYFKNDAIICSDSSKNINAVPENASSDFDFIQDEVKVFFNAIDNYEYMILIQDGKCVKTVVKKGDIGTYPEDEFEGMTFDEIYDEMKKSIE